MKKVLLLILFIIALSSCKVEQKEDICIVYTNDVGGEVNGEIGYAGVKGYLDEIKGENRYVALVDAGDYFEGDLADASNGSNIVKIMNQTGYDVVTIGNQDFRFGVDSLANNIANSDFPYVSCNIKYIGSGLNPLSKVKPYIIKNFGGIKVAFVGVTTPETILKPGKMSYDAVMKDGKAQFYFYEDDNGQELYKQVQKTVNKVRKKVDYVVVLAHLGSNSTIEGFNSYDLITNTNGIDVVIDGHSHTVISGEPVNNKDGEMVVLTSTGQKIQNVGLLRMHPDHTYTTVLYPSVYNFDGEVQALIDELYRSIGQ